MSQFVERFNSPNPTPYAGGGVTRVNRQTGRALTALESRTLIRLAGVQAEGYVQTEKVKEVEVESQRVVYERVRA